MKRNSRRNRAARAWSFRTLLLVTTALAGSAVAADDLPIATAATQLGAPPTASQPAAPAPAATAVKTTTIAALAASDQAPPAPPSVQPRINTTGHVVNITAPAMDGALYLGDIGVSIGTDDRIEFSSQRTLDLLATILDEKVLQTLKSNFLGKASLTATDFAGTGIGVRYDPQQISLIFDIPPGFKAARRVSVTAMDRERMGQFVKPAGFSAYLNTRAAFDYVSSGPSKGWADPIFSLDGAARWRNVVLESEAIATPGSDHGFQRLGTRLVFDDMKNLNRWTFGDLKVLGDGFQAAPDILGVSIFRSYGALQPDRIVRPRGDRTFTLTRPSTVEIYINGQMVRRLRLNPGTYNLRDFPFTQGANDIQVQIEDDTGSRENLRFNVFFDRNQLDKGLSEYALYAGVKAPMTSSGPQYTHDWIATGYYRRGISQNLTLGVNGQADNRTRMGAVEGVLGTKIGTFGFNLAASNMDGFGSGAAGNVTFQRLFQWSHGRSSSLNLFFESRSKEFAPVDLLAPDNRYAYEAGAAYTQAINKRLYAGFDARFSKGRDANRDAGTYRTTVGYRITPTIGMTMDTVYSDTIGQKGVSVLLSLTARLNGWSSVRADYNSQQNQARVSYQALKGDGVGAYSVNADVTRTDTSTGFNASATYFSNRAELGLSHYSTFDGTFGSPTDQRTELRVATAFAFADGAFSMGRPIYDAFAIVKPHDTLGAADVVVNPTPYGYTSESGWMRSALETNISGYTERTLTVNVPNAPPGYDIGSGAFRLFAPYRGGYKLVVGSAYSVTAIGRLVDASGAPISLLTGKAYEVAKPKTEPVVIFTNKDGRFGAMGLAPGRWRIEMATEPPTTFFLDVPAKTTGAVKVGDLHPSASGN